jgi:predicted transcriptional regulator
VKHLCRIDRGQWYGLTAHLDKRVFKINFIQSIIAMKGVSILREEVKQYIDMADEKVVKMIHAMLEVEHESDWWDELGDETKSSIEQGLKDARAGRVISHDVVMKKYRKWLSK